MDPEDAEKTVFITDEGVFWYKVMPFGLKNAGVKYQRFMTGIFKDLIRTTVEVNVDNLVIKSHTLEAHLSDI